MSPTRTLAGLFLLLLALAALSGCTGTTGEQPSVLLIVGYTDAAGGKVALLRSETLCTGPDPRCQAQSLLPGSERPLPAPPVAYDLANRPQARDELVVLSRAGTAVNGPAFLNFFLSANLSPDLPVEFAESRPAVALGPDLPRTPALLGRDIAFCPTHVQVSATGRYAAVLNDVRGVCGSFAALNSVVVLDLQPGVGAPPLIVDLFDDNVLPTRLFVRQTFAGTGDRLFWAQDRGATTRLLDVPLPRPAGTAPRTVAEIDGGLTNPVVDLRGLGDALIALRSTDFVPVLTPVDNPTPGERVATAVTAARRLVVQETGGLPSLVIIGQNRVAIHLDRDDAEPAELSVPGVVDGTIDAASFAYFASAPATPGGPGAISLFDFVFFGPNQPLPRLQRFPVTGLGTPSFVSWVLARAEAPVTAR